MGIRAGEGQAVFGQGGDQEMSRPRTRTLASCQSSYDNMTPEDDDEGEPEIQICACGEELGDDQEQCHDCEQQGKIDKLRLLCSEADELMDGLIDRCNITRVQLRAAADGRPIPATDAHRSEEDIRQIYKVFDKGKS